MKLKDLIKELDAIFDMNLALPGDPAGLQIGKINSEIKSVLLTLDITEDVIGEAVAEKT
ncbi:MAG: Nif3-like dinuclear metal center hexameric protein, partial [Actinobacteria bacterium]|nr:Nif3-like dinuclear metal center hexameric protein [Actinomycetota bacterium]